MKIKHPFLFSVLLALLFSCKKDNNDLTLVKEETAAKAPIEITKAYLVVITANSDTTKSEIIQVNN